MRIWILIGLVIVIPLSLLIGCQTLQTGSTTTTSSTTTTLPKYTLRVAFNPTITHYDDTHKEVTRDLNTVCLEDALTNVINVKFGNILLILLIFLQVITILLIINIILFLTAQLKSAIINALGGSGNMFRSLFLATPIFN